MRRPIYKNINTCRQIILYTVGNIANIAKGISSFGYLELIKWMVMANKVHTVNLHILYTTAGKGIYMPIKCA